MISLKDIYWAAGFLEGEGSFTYHGTGPLVSAGQVQKEPLLRLQKFVRGSLRPKAKSSNPRVQPAWRWALPSSRAAGLMMTLYSLMSPGRKLQIYNTLKVWRSHPPHGRYKKHCSRGHLLLGPNLYFNPNGRPQCKKCIKIRTEEWRQKHPRSRRFISKSQLAFEF